MKVIQLLPELNEGGVERGTVEISRELVKLGHESFVISKGGKLEERLRAEGGQHITLDVCSKNPFTAPLRALQLRKVLNEISPDIIHARSRVPAWLCRLANRSPHRPFVTTVHGLNSINKYSQVMVSGDKVIAVGEPIREYVCNAYNLDPSSITVIKRGVDMDTFDPAIVDESWISDFKKQYGLEGKKIITSVGRITKIKDYETYIDAIGILIQSQPNVAALIVGGAHPGKLDYLASLQQRVKDAGLDKHVHFVGSQTQMPAIYKLSDVIVNATLTMGNVGRTVIEGLAMGTPVICTTMDGLENIVTHDLNGYLIKVKDPQGLATSLDKALTKNWSDIRATVPYEFTLASMVENIVKVYQQTKTMSY